MALAQGRQALSIWLQNAKVGGVAKRDAVLSNAFIQPQKGTTRRRWHVLNRALTTYVKLEAHSLVRERPEAIQYLVEFDCNTEPVTVFSCKG